MKPEPICDPSNPRYVLGNQGGYSITLKSNNHVLWTRTGVRCRSNAVYADLVTMAVYEATGPHALKKTHFEVVVRDGQHSDEELAPIVEPLVRGEQYRDVVTMQDGRKFKSASCIKGRQAVVMGPNNKAYIGNGLLFGKPIELMPISNSVTASTQKEPIMTKKTQKATASDKVWVAASPKGGNVSDVSAVKALEKYIEQFGKRGKLKLYEAERSNGMVSFTSGCRMFKGTLPEIIAELKEKAIASAKAKARASTETAKPVVVIAEETYGNKVAGQIYGDVKAIASKLKSWKKSMSKEEYAQYEAYQKGVIKYVLSNVLSKLPEEYQTKIKAI